jgi:hypothetical protein
MGHSTSEANSTLSKSRNFPPFKESERSLPCLQGHRPFPEPDESLVYFFFHHLGALKKHSVSEVDSTSSFMTGGQKPNLLGFLVEVVPTAKKTQSAPPDRISRSAILITSSHLRLGLSSGLFTSGFLTKILYAFLMFRPSHPR